MEYFLNGGFCQSKQLAPFFDGEEPDCFVGLLLCEVIRALGKGFGLHMVFLDLPDHWFPNLPDPRNDLMCLSNTPILKPHRERPGILYVYQALQMAHNWAHLGRNRLGSQIWLFLLITEKAFQNSDS